MGFLIALGGLLAFIYAALVWLPIMLALDVLGRSQPGDFWFNVTWALFLPFGIGMVARHSDFNELKGEDYPESIGTIAIKLRAERGHESNLD